MSSKVVRGGTSSGEPPAWQRVSPFEALNGEFPGAGQALQPVPDAEHLRQAHQQGYEEGQAAIRHAHAAQLEAMQVKLARTIEEITSLRTRYRHEAEQDLVALALLVARRILHRELTVAPDALQGLVKAALEKMDAREVHRVRVSRQDAGIVQEFFEKMGLPQRIEVTPDPALAPGSVILESTRGSLDASVGTQLDEIERGFADLVGRVS
jgi:flagellar assembly protein FliH